MVLLAYARIRKPHQGNDALAGLKKRQRVVRAARVQAVVGGLEVAPEPFAGLGAGCESECEHA